MPKRLKGVPNLPFPPIVAGMYGLVAGTLIYAMPQWMFEHLVDLSGITRFVPAAQPPLGENARVMAAGGSVLGMTALLWPLLAMGQGVIRKMRKKPVVHQRARGIVVADSLDKPVEIEADLPGFDAPARAPIFAEQELGAPLMSEAALEAGDELMLDTPLDAPAVAPQPAPALASVLARPGMATPSVVDVEEEEAPALDPFEAVQPVEPSAWQLPSDYPTPPLYPVQANDSQFRLPEPVQRAPVVPEAVVDALPVALDFGPEEAESPAASETSLGFGSLAGAAEPAPVVEEVAASFDPFAAVQDWNLPPQAEAPRSAPEPAAPIDPFAALPQDPFQLPPLAVAEEGDAPATMAVAVEAQSFDPFSMVRDSLGAPQPEAPITPAAAEVVAYAAPEAPMVEASAPAATPAGEDNSVTGLMARLNSAMGAKIRPAAPAPQPAGMAQGWDCLRA